MKVSFLSLILFFIFSSQFTASAHTNNIFFASLEEISSGNKIISSKLYIMPVRIPFISEKFKNYKWTIYIDKHKNNKEVIDSAIKAFLSKYGKIFIESKTKKTDNSVKDIIITSFEGYFKGEVKFDKIELLKNKKKVYFHAFFTSLADINKKSKILFIDNLKSFYEEIKSFFIY